MKQYTTTYLRQMRVACLAMQRNKRVADELKHLCTLKDVELTIKKIDDELLSRAEAERAELSKYRVAYKTVTCNI